MNILCSTRSLKIIIIFWEHWFRNILPTDSEIFYHLQSPSLTTNWWTIEHSGMNQTLVAVCNWVHKPWLLFKERIPVWWPLFLLYMCMFVSLMSLWNSTSKAVFHFFPSLCCCFRNYSLFGTYMGENIWCRYHPSSVHLLGHFIIHLF